MEVLLYENNPRQLRRSFMLGSLDLEPPDGVTKFTKVDGASKPKKNGSATLESFVSDVQTTRFAHTHAADKSLVSQPWASKWSLLRQAAESGNRSTVNRILEKFEVHLKSSWRIPPLPLMSEAGNCAGVRKLLRFGADPLSCTKKGMNCLHVAAEYGRCVVMSILLDHTYERPMDQILSIRCTQSPNWTVLHYAAANDRAQVLSLLLSQPGIDKNAQDANGNTALIVACDYKSEEAVDELLENGAAVSVQNKEGKNCLSVAASRGYSALVQKLLAQAVNARYQEELGEISSAEVPPAQKFVNSRDARDEVARIGELWTPLHHAAAHNHEEVLRHLASHPDVEVDARDSSRRTPLMIASANGHALAASILLRFRADARLQDKNKETCLHAAASKGSTRVLATLLTIESLDIDALDVNKNTALIIACEFGHIEAVKQILQRKAAMGLIKQQNGSATKAALRKGVLSPEARASAHVHAVNKDGWNCLHMAASKGRVEDGDGNTALILAAKYDGCNCLHVAAEHGRLDLLKLLLVEADDEDFWGAQDEEGSRQPKIGDTGQSASAKVLFTNDLLAWNIVRLELMEKMSQGGFTPLHMAGRGLHIEVAILILRAYLIAALKVRGFSRHPRDRVMMPKFSTLVRDLVSGRYTIWERSSDGPSSSDEDSLRHPEDVGRTQWIDATEDFLIRNNLIAFWTSYKHLDDQTRPSKYFSVHDKVLKEAQNGNLVVSAFVDAYMTFISYCNAGDQQQQTFFHRIAEANFQAVDVDDTCHRSMECLLESPAIDVNAVDSRGDTPLHLATMNGNLCVVQCILSSGRTPHLAGENSGKRSPCSIAFANWQSALASGPALHKDKLETFSAILTLLEHVVIERTGQGSQVFREAESQFLDLLYYHLEDLSRTQYARKVRGTFNGKKHRERFGGLTLLHYAAYRGLGEELKVLLSNSDYQCLVNRTCSFGNQTVLHLAVERGHKDVVDILLKDEFEQGPTRTWYVRTTDEDAAQETPLEKAVKKKLNAAELNSFSSDKEFNLLLDKEFNAFKDIEQILLGKKDVKDYIDKLYRDRQVYVDASNAILVGAALIASVTFAGWLQPPLGYTEYSQYPVSDSFAPGASGYESFAAVQQYPSVRAFWIFNSLSFFFAVATVVCGAGAVLQMQSSRPSSTSIDIKKEVRRMRVWLMVTSTLMATAIFCVLGAFGAAGYAVLPPDIKYRTDMFVTVSIGASTCLICLYCFFKYSGIVKEGLEWIFGSPNKRSQVRQLSRRLAG
ncbi:hypothetical protein Mapa_012569 [Marchantia paleacea]|nr:hypothetical protein Mapa_012569 [Marchantia paleacea]